METKTQSHCWWFESHNSSKLSPWLQSTLSELNEKTKTMLKIIEADADSFAQRAEMYYRKRPELISMVEDFYRAHRSLAERYDQLKSDRVVRIQSPLSQSLSLSKVEYEDVFDSGNSVKSFDSFTEGAYSSEEAAESEVDDPEEVDQDEAETEHTFSGGASYVELMKLRDELNHLRKENEHQKTIIKQKDEEKEELLKRLSDNVNELRKFREEKDAIREDNLIALKEISEVSAPCDEVIKLKDEVERLKMENLYQREQVRKKAEEVLEITEKFEEAKFELIKLEQELQTSSGYFKNGLAVKESELLEVTKQFDVTKSELVKLRDEMRGVNVHLNAAHVGEYEDRKVEMRHFKAVVLMKDEGNCEAVEQLNDAFAEKDMDNEVITQQKNAFAETDAEKNGAIRYLSDALTEKDNEKDELIRQLKYKLAEKDAEKSEAMRRLKDAIIEKDMEKNVAIKQLNNTIEEKDEEKRELIRQLNNALEEKDEEKREVIRQLSIAMEILREESMRLKKTLVSISPRKESAEFQIFKGVNVGKIFSSSSSHEASVL